MNTYLIVSSLLNFSAALVLALTAFVTARRHFGSLSFGAFAIAVGVWSGAYSLWRLADSPQTALLLCRLLIFGAIFIPITLLHFALVLTGRRSRRLRVAGYGVALLLSGVNLTPALVESVGPAGGLEYWPSAGPLFVVFLLYFFGITVWSLVLLLSTKAGLGTTRGNRRTVAFILAIGFIGGSTNFPLWYGIPIPPVGNGLVFVYLGVLGFAVTKYRLPHLQKDLLKSAAFLGISTVVGVMFVLANVVVDILTGTAATTNELTSRFFFGTLVTAVALWAVPLMVELCERFLEQSLLRERYRLQRELKGLLRRIGGETEEATIFRNAAQRLADIFRARDVAIYFRGEFEPALRLRAGLPGLSCPIELSDDQALIRGITTQPGSITSGQLVMETSTSASSKSQALRDLGFELAVPMIAEGRLSGLLLLNRPPATRDDSDAVLSMVEAISVQLALTVTARRLERRANQSDKLIALGTLAAGLAHELRNPLTSITTFASLVESGADPMSDPRFLKIVLRDSHRISSIVENVSVFATNADQSMAPLELERVLTSTLEIARTESVGTNVQTRLQCGVDRPVRGNFGQLQQVFINLVQNAMQAIGSRMGEIEIVAEPIVLANGHPGARVVVRDTGPGVAPEVLPRIFEPFVTTKATGERSGKRGLGLGLAIVKRIIEAHRGDIRVESTPGKGTSFFVYLPVHTGT